MKYPCPFTSLWRVRFCTAGEVATIYSNLISKARQDQSINQYMYTNISMYTIYMCTHISFFKESALYSEMVKVLI